MKMFQIGIAAIVIVLGFSAWAHFPIGVSHPDGKGLLDVGWTPVQLGIYPDCDCPMQLASGTADVYGIGVGILMLHQHSAVISVALCNMIENNYFLEFGGIATCNRNYGLVLGWLNGIERNYGLSVGVFNLEDGFGDFRHDQGSMACGLQIGLVNAGGGFQIGLLNYNGDALIPFFPIINFPWPWD